MGSARCDFSQILKRDSKICPAFIGVAVKLNLVSVALADGRGGAGDVELGQSLGDVSSHSG